MVNRAEYLIVVSISFLIDVVMRLWVDKAGNLATDLPSADVDVMRVVTLHDTHSVIVSYFRLVCRLTKLNQHLAHGSSWKPRESTKRLRTRSSISNLCVLHSLGSILLLYPSTQETLLLGTAETNTLA